MFSNESRPEERAEYLAIRDTCQWLVRRLYDSRQLDQGSRLDKLFKTFVDDYWDKLRAGEPTKSALQAMWNLMNAAAAEVDQATLTFPDGDLPDNDPDIEAGLNHLRRLRQAERGIPEM